MDLVSKIGIFLGVLALGVSVVAWFSPYVWPKMPHWISQTGVGLGLVLILASFACLFVLPDEQKPEVTLKFVIPESPDLLLVNTSRAVATEIKWMIVAWNLDLLTQRRDPLPIPASTFDLLTSGSAAFPINVFQTSMVAPLVKQGDRIFGSATVICPACPRGRTFWVYIVWGQGGWYSENSTVTNGNIVAPKKKEKYIEEFVNQTINSIPLSARIPIRSVP
jgi:hypothetical protein